MTTAYAARSCLAVQKFLHPDTQWREHTVFLFISISTRENMSFYDTFCNSDSFYARDMVAVYQMIMGLKEGVVCFMHEKRQSMKMFRPKRRGGVLYTSIDLYDISSQGSSLLCFLSGRNNVCAYLSEDSLH